MNNRTWNVLCWNVRGMNAKKKWNAIKDRATESHSDVICLQETKKEHFDDMFLRNFCPPSFDKFAFLPSDGASGAIVVAWKSSVFQGQLVFQNDYALSIQFNSLHNDAMWILTNVYVPCTPEGKKLWIGSKTSICLTMLIGLF